MMTKVWQRLAMLMTLIPVLLLAVSAVAQNATEVELTTLEELTADSASFRGEVVALEGFVAEFVNINTIVVGENAGVDDDRILVVNNTGEYFSADLFKGTEVRIQGLVHPSLDEHNAMMEEAAMNEEAMEESTPDVEPMVTEEADMDMMNDDTMVTEEADMDMMNDDTMSMSLDYYYDGKLPEAYNGFTVLELTDMEMLNIVKRDDE